MNLQEELKALKERIAELEEQVKEEREFPQFGDEYWYSNHDGGVLPSTYDNHYMDRDRHSIGNVFRTKEQAEFAVEKLKVEAELRKYSRPFEVNDSNVNILYDYDKQSLIYSPIFSVHTQGYIYFESAKKKHNKLLKQSEKTVSRNTFLEWRINNERQTKTNYDVYEYPK